MRLSQSRFNEVTGKTTTLGMYFDEDFYIRVDDKFNVRVTAIGALLELLVAARKTLEWWAEHKYDDTGGDDPYNVYDDPPEFVVKAFDALQKANELPDGASL